MINLEKIVPKEETIVLNYPVNEFGETVNYRFVFAVNNYDNVYEFCILNDKNDVAFNFQVPGKQKAFMFLLNETLPDFLELGKVYDFATLNHKESDYFNRILEKISFEKEETKKRSVFFIPCIKSLNFEFNNDYYVKYFNKQISSFTKVGKAILDAIDVHKNLQILDNIQNQYLKDFFERNSAMVIKNNLTCIKNRKEHFFDNDNRFEFSISFENVVNYKFNLSCFMAKNNKIYSFSSSNTVFDLERIKEIMMEFNHKLRKKNFNVSDYFKILKQKDEYNINDLYKIAYIKTLYSINESDRLVVLPTLSDVLSNFYIDFMRLYSD